MQAIISGLLICLFSNPVLAVPQTGKCALCKECTLSSQGNELRCCEDSGLCYLGDVPKCAISPNSQYPDLPGCLCKSGYGGHFCNQTCSCTVPNTFCDLLGYCNCNNTKCMSGAFISCDSNRTASCNCSMGWKGTMCDECISGHYGPNCTTCSACTDPNSACDDGITGAGKCKCSNCAPTGGEMLGMVLLSVAMAIVAAFAAINAAVASRHPNAQIHSATRSLSLFLFASMFARGLVITINSISNSDPRYDTVLEVVTDIPGLIEVSMFAYLLVHAFTTVQSKRQQNPECALRAAAAASLIAPSSPSAFLVPMSPPKSIVSFSDRATNLNHTVSQFVVVSNVRELVNVCVFSMLLLLLVCIPLLLNQKSNSYFKTARYSIWFAAYLILAVLYFIASSGFTSRASLTEIFWTRQRLSRACRICQISCLLRAIMVMTALVLNYKDLIRPSLSISNFLFQYSYYVFADLMPAFFLLRLLWVEPLRYSIVADEFASCFINPSLLTIDEPISSGSTGIVFTGRLLDLSVACKQQRINDFRVLNEVVHEATLLIRLRHPNIVAFYGLSLSHPVCYLVTEKCDCSLSDLLTYDNLSQINRTMILKQICDGMAYLHQRGMIHRDLKPENVLLQSGVAKICDFGTATMLRSTVELTTRIGTPLFMAPEVLAASEHAPYTHHIDVFSFGVLMWCVCCGKNPYGNIQTSNAWDLVRRVQGGLRPSREEARITNDALWLLLERCWEGDASLRPEFSQIQKELERIFDNDPNALPEISV
eukprot:c6028_g1_i2.p1 GENE.c6028_g1_i2~~c6028_g1_i2.p1  ORF type:complete len:789 (+),score=99.27 c6028_g1_i2:70-2367(+)